MSTEDKREQCLVLANVAEVMGHAFVKDRERCGICATCNPPFVCPDHRPVQHRDMKPPWCPHCGLTEDYQEPVRRARGGRP